MFFAVLITGCGATLKPINTLQRINRPVVAIEAARLPDIVLKHYTAEIPFLAGDYSAYDNTAMARAVAALGQHSGTRTLKIEGYSYSKGDSASQALALKRASVVANVMIASGYDPRTIQQVGIHANHLKTIPFVGAKIHWVSTQDAENNKTTPITSVLETPTKPVKDNSKRPTLDLSLTPALVPALPQETLTVLPVGFSPGNYRSPHSQDVTALISALPKDLSRIQEINVIGHSRSRSNLATEHLALKRAKLVVRQLRGAGIAASLITVKADSRNQLKHVGTYPGAVVTMKIAAEIEQPLEAQSAPVVPSTHRHIGKEIEPPKRREGLTDGVEGTSPPTDEERVILVQTSTVYVLHVEQGSLRDNIERILKEHKYSFGQWRFARPGVSYDWNIPKRFSYPLMGGLPEILAVLSRLYEFQATINELDRTVDFHSINEVLPSA